MKTALLVLFAMTTNVLAEEKPKPLPLQLKLIAKKDTYKTDITAEELKKAIAAAKDGGKLPPAPQVDMVLEITNTSDKDVSFWHKGDPVQVDLILAGPGAMVATPQLAFTLEFRLPEAMKLAPGKSHTIPLKSLQFGMRGVAQVAFWSDPGDYTLAAAFKTAINPAPKGTEPDENGFGKVVLESKAVKLKIEKK